MSDQVTTVYDNVHDAQRDNIYQNKEFEAKNDLENYAVLRVGLLEVECKVRGVTAAEDVGHGGGVSMRGRGTQSTVTVPWTSTVKRPPPA
eukprot:15983916-Heterocapsa_arctica.AAC.1